jgi:hypothetical protein
MSQKGEKWHKVVRSGRKPNVGTRFFLPHLRTGKE